MNPIALFQRLRVGADGSESSQNYSESTMRLAQTVSQLQQQTIQQTNTLSQLQQKIVQLEKENHKLTHYARNSAFSTTASPVLLASSMGKHQGNKISLDSIISKYSNDTSKTSKIPRLGNQMTDSSLEKKITLNQEAEAVKKEGDDARVKAQQAQGQPYGQGQVQENMDLLTVKSIVHLDGQEAQVQNGVYSVYYAYPQGQYYYNAAPEQQMVQYMMQQYPGAFLGEDGQWYYYPQDQYVYQQYPQYSQYNMDPYAQYQQPYEQDPAAQQIQSQFLLTQQSDPAYEQYMQQYQLMQQQMEQFNQLASVALQPEPEPETLSAVDKSVHSPSKQKPKAQSYPRKKGIIEQKDTNGIPVFKVNADDVKPSRERIAVEGAAGRMKNGVYVERVRFD